MHHRGSDIRYKKEKWAFLKFTDKILVSTPDLLQWSPNAIWIPNLIDLEKYYYRTDNKEKNEINIVHAPSNRGHKGTEFVINAVELLKSEGYHISLSLIENMDHNSVIKYFQNADIVIDQLIIGWYGNVAIESMAFGKPVCVFIRQDLESFLPFMPFCNTSTDNLVENLRSLVENKKQRQELGEKARVYVEKMHDPVTLTERIYHLYEEIL